MCYLICSICIICRRTTTRTSKCWSKTSQPLLSYLVGISVCRLVKVLMIDVCILSCDLALENPSMTEEQVVTLLKMAHVQAEQSNGMYNEVTLTSYLSNKKIGKPSEFTTVPL